MAPDDVFSKEASIIAWFLQPNGTVRISRAAFSDPQAVSGYPAAYQSKFTYTDDTKLHRMMDKEPSYPRDSQYEADQFAVYLQSNGRIRTGIVLEGLKHKPLSGGGNHGGATYANWIRYHLDQDCYILLYPETGAGGRKEAAPIPAESAVDWLVR